MKIEEILTPEILARSRAAILTEFNPDSCIASTAIFIQVLGQLGFKAKPLVVQTNIYNPILARWIDEHGRSLPQDEASWKQITEAGGRMVVLGARRREDGEGPKTDLNGEKKLWPGHLVVAIKPAGDTSGFLVDLSIDQASRPQKEIVIKGPLRFDIPREEWGKVMAGGGFVAGREGGIRIEVFAFPSDAGYQASRDWYEQKTRYAVMSGEITSSIRDLIKQKKAAAKEAS